MLSLSHSSTQSIWRAIFPLSEKMLLYCDVVFDLNQNVSLQIHVCTLLLTSECCVELMELIMSGPWAKQHAYNRPEEKHCTVARTDSFWLKHLTKGSYERHTVMWFCPRLHARHDSVTAQASVEEHSSYHGEATSPCFLTNNSLLKYWRRNTVFYSS